MVNLINIFVKNKKFSYSNLGKARSYSYDGLGNRIGFKGHEKKIKLNKYTEKLFFLWNRNEKLYWLVYIIIISESILFIVIWVLYFLGDINIFRNFLNIYVGICSIFDTILVIKILIKRVKDYITSKNR